MGLRMQSLVSGVIVLHFVRLSTTTVGFGAVDKRYVSFTQKHVSSECYPGSDCSVRLSAQHNWEINFVKRNFQETVLGIQNNHMYTFGAPYHRTGGDAEASDVYCTSKPGKKTHTKKMFFCNLGELTL